MMTVYTLYYYYYYSITEMKIKNNCYTKLYCFFIYVQCDEMMGGVRYFFVYSFFMQDHVVFLTFETVGSGGVEDTLVVDRS